MEGKNTIILNIIQSQCDVFGNIYFVIYTLILLPIFPTVSFKPKKNTVCNVKVGIWYLAVNIHLEDTKYLKKCKTAFLHIENSIITLK